MCAVCVEHLWNDILHNDRCTVNVIIIITDLFFLFIPIHFRIIIHSTATGTFLMEICRRCLPLLVLFCAR